jgi:hypothetical protein
LQDLVKRLLKQSEGERIGVGAEGIQKIRRHPFFKVGPLYKLHLAVQVASAHSCVTIHVIMKPTGFNP